MLGSRRSLVRQLVGGAVALVVAAGSVLVAGQSVALAADQTSFYVAPNGSDSNPGTLASPFATVQKAQSAVREVNTQMTGDIHVYLRGGTYPITSTVEFTPADSGSNGHQVVYSAYDSETPVLEAGTKISGWTQQSGNIWKAPLSRDDKLRSLYVNDKRAVMASKSVTSGGCFGSYSITAGQAPWAWDSGTECDGAKYALSDVPDIPTNQSDVEVQSDYTWTTSIVGVRQVTTSPDGASRVLLFQQPGAAIATHALNGNFSLAGTHKIMNAYQFLDTPGEFFFDRAAQTLYYYKAAADDLTSASVYAPNNVTTILGLTGASTSDRVHDVTISGLTFQHSDWNLSSLDGSSFKQAQQGNLVNTDYAGANFHDYYYRNVDVQPAAVEIRNATSIQFSGNRVQHTGADGIDLVNDVSNTQLTGNVTDDIGGTAITIGHPQNVFIGDATATNGERYAAGVEGAAKNVSVTNNYIHDSAVLFAGSAAVAAYFTDTLTFEHNRIEKTQWAGISLGWGWWNFDGSNGSVTPGNPTTTAKNNMVRYNQFIDTVQDRSDSSPMYTLGGQPGSIVSDNYVQGLRAGYVNGIHTDEGSANITYTNNVLDVDPDTDFAVSTGNWGKQHALTIVNNYGINNKIKDKDVLDSTVQNMIVSPDAVWPSAAYAIASGSGLEAAYGDLLGAGGSTSPDYVLTASTSVASGTTATVPIRNSGDATKTLWLAPVGATSFAAGPTMTSAGGTATAIAVPTTPGAYRLYVVGADGAVSNPSQKAVWRLAPAPQDAKIVGVGSNLCIDTPGGATTNGTQLILNTCSSAVGQRWTYTAAKELRVAGGKCLDAYGFGQYLGTPVDLWDCNGGPNQVWDLHPNGTITGVQSSLCVEASNSGASVNTPLQLNECANTSGQRWGFESTPATPVTVTAKASSSTGVNAAGWYRSPVSVTLTSSSADAAVEFRTSDIASWAPVTGPVIITADGSTQLQYRAVRDGSPVAGSAGSVLVKLDRRAPVSSVRLDPNSGVVVAGRSVTARFSAQDATSGVAAVEYSLDGGTSWKRGAAATVTKVGNHRILYRSIDRAGNVEPARAVTVKVTEPTGPAAVSIRSSDTRLSQGWYQQPVKVTLTAPRYSTGTVQYRIDGGRWTIYRTPVTVSRTGITVLQHRRVLGSQVVSGSLRSITVKVDRTRPVTTARLSPRSGSGTTRTPVFLTLSPGDTGSGVSFLQYRIGAGGWITARGAVTEKFIAVGTQVVSYRSQDGAGNLETTRTVRVVIRAASGRR